MPGQEFILRCAHCRKDTRIVIEAPKSSASTRGKQVKKIQLVRYCEHCNRPNILNVPETWDDDSLVLGDNVVGYSSGIPVIEGEKL
jgi:hypothetical protein